MDDRYENWTPREGEEENGGRGSWSSNGEEESYGGKSGSYHSPYDAYRFQTPGGIKPAPEAAPKKEHHYVQATLAVIGVLALLALSAYLIYAAVSGISLKELIPGLAPGKTPSQEPRKEIVLGRQDSGEAPAEEQPSSDLTVPGIVEKAMPSMASVANVSVSEYEAISGGTAEKKDGTLIGSGIIVAETDAELLIATNDHLIKGAKEIAVALADGSLHAGEIRGRDEENDLAVIAVPLSGLSETTKKAVSVITIGDSDKVIVGESVIAIGNALGYGQSVSAGIVSAKGKLSTDAQGTMRDLIQTDAPINPGNSGGALLNMRGELIGINEAKYISTKVEGVGYAIPTATAMPILTKLGDLKTREKVAEENASYIGITCVTMPEEYTGAGYPAGVYVMELEKDGPAEKAGLQEGDIITALGGTMLYAQEELIEELTYYAAGEEVEVTVSRLVEDENRFETLTIPVVLGSRADMKISSPSAASGAAAPESGEASADGETAPADGETPADGEAAPAVSEAPEAGETASAVSEEAEAGETTPANGEAPADDAATPAVSEAAENDAPSGADEAVSGADDAPSGADEESAAADETDSAAEEAAPGQSGGIPGGRYGNGKR